MVEINYRIVITGIISLAAMYITLCFTGKDTDSIGFLIVGVISLAIGVIIVPSPKIDNKRGMLKW